MPILSDQHDKHTRKDNPSVLTNIFIWYISNKICYSGRVYTQMKNWPTRHMVSFDQANFDLPKIISKKMFNP